MFADQIWKSVAIAHAQKSYSCKRIADTAPNLCSCNFTAFGKEVRNHLKYLRLKHLSTYTLNHLNLLKAHFTIITMSNGAWALVKWIEEDRISVIPTGWIVKPSDLAMDLKLPVSGSCYWKKKTNLYETLILEISGTL